MNINKIIPKENYLLYIESADGRSGTLDCKPFLEAEAFLPLKDPSAFVRIYNGKYFIAWDCGADLSADTIFALWSELGATEKLPNELSENYR